MTDKHTPGPWQFGYEDHSGPEFIVSKSGKTVATLRWGCSCCKNTPENFLDMTPEERGNARLIAAAPELLEALQQIAVLDAGVGNFKVSARVRKAANIARVAIAKAEGK